MSLTMPLRLLLTLVRVDVRSAWALLSGNWEIWGRIARRVLRSRRTVPRALVTSESTLWSSALAALEVLAVVFASVPDRAARLLWTLLRLPVIPATTALSSWVVPDVVELARLLRAVPNVLM